MKRKICILCALLGVVMLLTSCWAEMDPPASLYVKLVAPKVEQENVTALLESLKEAFPDVSGDEGKGIDVAGICLDESATSFQIVVLMYANEVELLICDAERSAEIAGGGDHFAALDTLFSAEELDRMGGAPVTFYRVDEDGRPTDEISKICGLDLSKNERAVALCGIKRPQIFIVANTKNIEAAKQAFAYLATLS